MALGSDILRLIVTGDTSGAVKEFQRLGKKIDDTGDKAATGFKGKLTGAFDSLQAKSPMVSGIFDKIGVSSQQAAGVIAAAIPAAGVAAAAGLVAFAAKGVKAFQDTALAAGKFADSTGLSVESASRYIAVADDIGVGASTIQGAFVKMEKAMATNKAAFGDLIATTKSGGVDLDQTFLNAITHLQGIKDPIERANESAKLFGKGFSEVAQILGTDADTLKAKLADVSSAQVINQGELQKARDYQAAMDDLGDSVKDLSIRLGQNLVPALTSAASAAATAVGWYDKLAASLGAADKAAGTGEGGLFGKLTGNKSFDSKSWSEFFGVVVDGSAAIGKVDFSHLEAGLVNAGGLFGGATVAARDFGGSADAVAGSLGFEAAALQAANDALAAHTNAQLAAFDSAFAVKDANDQFAKALMAAETAAVSGTASAGELATAYDDETQAAVKSAEAAVRHADDLAKAEGKTLSAKEANQVLIGTLSSLAGQASGPTRDALQQLISKLQETGQQKPQPTVTLNDQASAPVNAVQTKLDVIGRTRATAAIHADDQTSGPFRDAQARGNAWAGKVFTATIKTITLGVGAVGKIAEGTDNWRGGLALVGERGPELAILPQGTQVKTAAETKKIMNGPSPLALSSGGSSSSTVVHITVNGAVDPYNTARQIQTILAKGTRGGFSTLAA